MQGESRVSVVSAVRNGERYLSEALESVMGQTLPPDEVLVIDDGSTDATADIARSCGARVMPSRGRGVSDARNTGIAECRCDLIAFIDHDDVWEPHKLERQVAHLETHPEVGYVLCWLRVVIEPGFERRERDLREQQGWGAHPGHGDVLRIHARHGELDDVRTVLDPPLRSGEPRRRALNGLVRDAVGEPQEQVINIVVEMEFPGWRPAKHGAHRAPPSGQ